MVGCCTLVPQGLACATAPRPSTTSSCARSVPCTISGLPRPQGFKSPFQRSKAPCSSSEAGRSWGWGRREAGRWRSSERRGVALASSDGDGQNGGGQVDEQVDRKYFAAVGAGCLGGAFVVKYGSLLIPQVTHSANLALALTMILGPMAIAAIVLVVAGVKENSS